MAAPVCELYRDPRSFCLVVPSFLGFFHLHEQYGLSPRLHSKQQDKRIEKEKHTFPLRIKPVSFTDQFCPHPTGWHLVITGHIQL